MERKAFGAGTTTDFQFTAIPVRANDVQKVIDMFKKAARRKPNVKYMAEDSGSFTIKKAGETPADVSENLKAAIKEYMSNPDNEKAAALIGLANDALDGRFSDSKIDDLVIEIFDLVTVSSKEYIDKLELNSAIERQYYRLSIFSDRIRHSLYDDKEYQRAIDRLDEAMRPFGIGYSARIGNSFFQFSSGEGRAVLEKIIGTAEDIKVKMDPNIIPVDIWRNPKYNYNRYGTGKQFDRGGQMFLYKHAFLNIKQLDALTELFKAEAAPKSAIMTKNYPRVYAWLASGDSVLKTLIKLAFAELIPSMNTDAFVAGHPLQNRDAAENLSIVTMLSFVAGFLFFTAAFLSGGLGMFLLASAVSSAIAVIPAAAYHIFLDYKTVKKMSEEVSGFAGNQEIKNTQEAQNLEVIILGELPENPEKYGFRNAGLTVDGEIIWISKKTGRLVIFSNSKDTAKIADEMNGMIPKITGKKSAAFEISALIVEDRGNNEMRFEYAYDIPVVSKTYYDMIAKLSGGDLIVAGERMRKEAKAEKDAAARNFVMDLSFIKSNEDLLKAVNAYNKSGNQQIALPVEFFQGKSDGEIKKLVSAMSGNGTRVFAVIGKESALNDHDKNNLQKALINYGFAGYALKDGVETVFRDYTSDKNSKARKISGFNTEEQLISEIEKTGYDTVKLIDVANYIKIIENNRDIAARIESLVGLFGSKILTLFDFGSNITADYAVNKVLDTDIGIIPSFSTTYQETDINNFFAIFEKYIQGLKLSEAEQTFIDLQTDKIYAVPEFAVFLQRINKNADQSAGADAVKKAFIATIFKKMKVKYDTDGAGLQDRELERLMTNTALSGIAAVKNEINEFRQDIMRDAVMQAFPNENMSNFAMFDGKTYSPEDIINGSARYEVNGKEIIITADIVYSAAEIRSKELSLRSSAYAATAYELLLLYAERRRSDNAADNSSMKIDPNAVATILTQA
ncbi:MAG: hypothetical protein FWC57_04590 [Endomicrobia bacterium]|nr:hypothetical protein [Endomicrobiia bacterium]